MSRKFSMHLDDAAVVRIEQLQRRTKSASVSDVIRLGLLVLDEQVNWLRAGGSMFVQSAPGAPLRPYNPILSGDEITVPPGPVASPVAFGSTHQQPPLGGNPDSGGAATPRKKVAAVGG